MNQIEIGKLIAQKRQEKGLTQKQLADLLFVTDKAVSKWERGLSTPDYSCLVKLSNLIETDIEILLPEDNGNEIYGHIIINNKNFIYKRKLSYQTVFEHLLSYYLLFGIKNIYVDCDDTKFVNSINFSQYDFSIHLNVNKPEHKYLEICDNILLFGANLTRYFKALFKLEMNVSIYQNKKMLPISIKGYEKSCERELGRGYFCSIITNDNFDELDVLTKTLSKYFGFNLNKLSDIKSNRLK